MAGGKGTRLGDLTKNTPKLMLKVAGRPVLERLELHLVGTHRSTPLWQSGHLSPADHSRRPILSTSSIVSNEALRRTLP